MTNSRQRKFFGGHILLLIVACLAGGCAHQRSGTDGLFLPEVPAFLSGPMSVLLTNAASYSAHLVMTTAPTLAGKADVVAGELLARRGTLLFAQDKQTSDKRARNAGLSFIWDVQQNSGYLLSEPLQGYAPVAFGMRYTNLVFRAGVSGPQRIDGHRCNEQEVTVASNEGSATQIQAWRAADLNGMALRLVTTSKLAPQSLELSKVRTAAPRLELFKPPEGFTRYENSDIMMSELTVRQHNLKRRPAEEWDDQEPRRPGSPPYQRPR